MLLLCGYARFCSASALFVLHVLPWFAVLVPRAIDTSTAKVVVFPRCTAVQRRGKVP